MSPMTTKKQKLELTWIGKNNPEHDIANIEPRILEERTDLSYGDKKSENMIIHGDNLLALKALLPEYEGKIKCVYIDPPYNTRNAFDSYDDSVEHSIWLSLMKPRLELIWQLLSPHNGVLLISINDDEAHYLKVLCDELLGRNSFVASLVWNYEGNTDNQAKIINYHEYILVYSKTGDIDEPGVIDPNIAEGSKLYRSEIRNTVVKNGPKNPLVTVTLPSGFPCNFEAGIIKSKDVIFPQYSADIEVEDFKIVYDVRATTGWSSRTILENFIDGGFKPVQDSKGQKTIFELTKTGAIEAVKEREQRKGHFISVLRGFGTVNQMRLFLEKLKIKFTYPKPVDLIAYLIEAFTSSNDLVLDSFAGSGTTGHAVLKLNRLKNSHRKFILIECIDKTVKEITIPRICTAIKGSLEMNLDPLGGGFKFFELAPSFITIDEFGNPVIDIFYNDAKLIRAMCKLTNYTFAPSQTNYWRHGKGQGKNSIYVTTQMLSVAMTKKIARHLKPNETLLICPKKFEPGCEKVDARVTIKKIPQSILKACQYGKKEYLLPIKERTIEEIDDEDLISDDE